CSRPGAAAKPGKLRESRCALRSARSFFEAQERSRRTFRDVVLSGRHGTRSERRHYFFPGSAPGGSEGAGEGRKPLSPQDLKLPVIRGQPVTAQRPLPGSNRG